MTGATTILEREVRANLVYRAFTRIDAGEVQYAMDVENARAYALRFHDDAAQNLRFTDIPNGDA